MKLDIALLIAAAAWHGGGFGVRTPFCAKCDVFFSYIYTNTIKRVLYLFHLYV